MPRTILVVDDLRSFPPLEESAHVVYARTSAEALAVLESRQWDEVWLDHDLGMPQGMLDDIMPVVDRLAELAYFDLTLPTAHIVVHTSNSPGRASIVRSLERYYAVRIVDALRAGSTTTPLA